MFAPTSRTTFPGFNNSLTIPTDTSSRVPFKYKSL